MSIKIGVSMLTNNLRRIIFPLLTFCSISFSYAQNSVGVALHRVDSTENTYDFNITITNTSGRPMVLQSGSYGLDWNYEEMGAGEVSLTYVPESSQLNSAQTNFSTINTFIDKNTHSIRISAQLVTNRDSGTPLPENQKVIVGTFRLTKTSGTWKPGVSPTFTWIKVNKTYKTRTSTTLYMDNNSTASIGILSPEPSVK